jgi:hypothetical protein
MSAAPVASVPESRDGGGVEAHISI